MLPPRDAILLVARRSPDRRALGAQSIEAEVFIGSCPT
jgi:hypothetical protein